LDPRTGLDNVERMLLHLDVSKMARERVGCIQFDDLESWVIRHSSEPPGSTKHANVLLLVAEFISEMRSLNWCVPLVLQPFDLKYSPKLIMRPTGMKVVEISTRNS
jgi:hypothetical protein